MKRVKKLKIDGREIDPNKLWQPKYNSGPIVWECYRKDLKEIFHELMLEDYKQRMEHDTKVFNSVFEK